MSRSQLVGILSAIGAVLAALMPLIPGLGPILGDGLVVPISVVAGTLLTAVTVFTEELKAGSAKLTTWLGVVAVIVGIGLETDFLTLFGAQQETIAVGLRVVGAILTGLGYPIWRPATATAKQLGVLLALAGVGGLMACGGSVAPNVAVQPLAVPGDTIAYRLVAHPQAGSQVTAARWKITADNVNAGSFADALEAVVVWAKPAPLACVNFKAIAWAVRADRQTGALRLSKDSTVKAWQRCEGDTDPPGLDSVSVVELTLPAE